MPPPCGVSRSRTAWASATPTQTSANSVTAIPGAPARGWASATRNVSGTAAASAPRTASGPPACAAHSSPAKPTKPAKRTGCPAASRSKASPRQTKPSAIRPATKTQSPKYTMRAAKAIAGTATTTRAARSELWLRRLAATEPPLARAVLGQRGLEGLAGEVGPQLVAEHQLRVGRLPHQVVGQPVLAARADDEVGVVHLGRVEQLAECLLAPAGVARGGVDDLGAPAVVEGDEQRDPFVGRRRALGPLHALDELGADAVAPSDEAHAHALV